jgi:molybdate transport system substrate-binding protein
MQPSLHVLSGGAANGLVSRLEARFTARTGMAIAGTFSAVGQMKDALLAGAPCDVVILTQALIDELMASSHLLPGSARPVGLVRTGVAVAKGQAAPDVGSADALRQALLGARAIYVPDLSRSTAGLHIMKVLRTLGIEQQVAEQLRPFPNGQTAMAAMARAAQAGEQGLIGCTQVTEILNTPGVALAGLLPAGLELSTLYVAAVARSSGAAPAATELIALLSDPSHEATRRDCGFD